MRKLVIGDIHGNYRGMMQALKRAKFKPESDQLITLGDIVDGHNDVMACLDFLIELFNAIHIRGNHDKWCEEWLDHGSYPAIWYNQGGKYTMEQFLEVKAQENPKYLKFFKSQHNYYVDDDNRAFVHGGYHQHEGLGHDIEQEYYWNRDLWKIAMSGNNSQDMPKLLRPYKEIFIGHTTTMMWETDKPMHKCNVWNLDTGAGYTGKVTVMDADTEKYWQSEKAVDLDYHFRR